MQNIIGLWPNLSRAVEIALLGNYTISIHFDPDYTTGFEDFALIKEFFPVKFVTEGDLKVEIFKPDSISIKQINGFQNLDDIFRRVERAKEVKCSDHFSDVNNSLLSVASERLNFSVYTMSKVKEIAKTIAMLSLSESIKVEHVAEATHYAHMIGGVNALDGHIKFGGISVSLCEHSPENIEKAISYLKSL